jgi:hypothetical protein
MPTLLIDEQLRVADHVDEKDVADLELDFFLNFGGHLVTDRKRQGD